MHHFPHSISDQIASIYPGFYCYSLCCCFDCFMMQRCVHFVVHQIGYFLRLMKLYLKLKVFLLSDGTCILFIVSYSFTRNNIKTVAHIPSRHLILIFLTHENISVQIYNSIGLTLNKVACYMGTNFVFSFLKTQLWRNSSFITKYLKYTLEMINMINYKITISYLMVML